MHIFDECWLFLFLDASNTQLDRIQILNWFGKTEHSNAQGWVRCEQRRTEAAAVMDDLFGAVFDANLFPRLSYSSRSLGQETDCVTKKSLAARLQIWSSIAMKENVVRTT